MPNDYLAYFGILKAMKYPITRRKPVTDVMHGHKLVDNYRWLEDSDSAEVLRWSKEQNAFTEKILQENIETKSLHEELKKLYNFDSVGLPSEYGGYYFWSERKAGRDQSAIYRRHGIAGKPEVLIDPNDMASDSTVTVSGWQVSPNAKYLTYTLSEGGTEMGTIYTLELGSMTTLQQDTVPYSRGSQINWLQDESAFFYVRNPEPGSVPKGEEHLHYKVYKHRIGGDYTLDKIVFGKGRHKEDAYSLDMSDDRSTLIIGAGRDWTKNEIWIHNVESGKTTDVVTGIEAMFDLQIVRGKAYMWTNYRAEYGKVMVAEIGALPSSIEKWNVFVAETELSLSGVHFTKDFCLAVYLKNACSVVEMLDENGFKLKELFLPKFSTIEGLSCQADKSEFFYSYTNFVTPNESYRYDPHTKAVVPYHNIESPVSSDDYIVRQLWFDSKDQVSVPMFVVHNKSIKLDGRNPTLLHGYGGFASPVTPSFLRSYIPFIENGGVFVSVNLRGGNEFGSKWHENGMLDKKQNTFDDFIAAAEYLIDNSYTSPKKLAIMGGSNGGLLVGACMVQCPDLFKAVVCRVPLLDMVRFPMFLIAGRWTSEYGDPQVEAEYNYIIKYSPYHNVVPGVEYPATLLMTADHDSRVEPLHARKMAALLQATNSSSPILLRTDFNAGHGVGKPLSKSIDDVVAILSFVFWQLQMK